MLCSGMCCWPEPSPGAMGSSCAEDEQCTSGLCAGVSSSSHRSASSIVRALGALRWRTVQGAQSLRSATSEAICRDPFSTSLYLAVGYAHSGANTELGYEWSASCSLTITTEERLVALLEVVMKNVLALQKLSQDVDDSADFLDSQGSKGCSHLSLLLC
jgi:hypothetical protein